ncbi:MAG: hypothetical protein AAFX99_35600 [Myxococcota bacterium]
MPGERAAHPSPTPPNATSPITTTQRPTSGWVAMTNAPRATSTDSPKNMPIATEGDTATTTGA